MNRSPVSALGALLFAQIAQIPLAACYGRSACHHILIFVSLPYRVLSGLPGKGRPVRAILVPHVPWAIGVYLSPSLKHTLERASNVFTLGKPHVSILLSLSLLPQ